MRTSQFSVELIIHALKENEAGTRTADVCQRLGVSDTIPTGRTDFGYR